MSKPTSTKPTPLVSYQSFKFYRELYSKDKEQKSPHIVYEKKDYFKIAYALCREIVKQFLTNSHGLVLDGIGYLCIWRSPKKKIFRRNSGKGKIVEANYHTDGYQYHPTLITDIFYRHILSGWSMDRAFNQGVNQQLSKNLIAGEKYKFDVELVQSFYKNKKITKNL